jgi:hypothetical protein
MTDTTKLMLKTDHEQTVDIEFTYDESVIPIKNPVFSAYYAYSTELEQKMSKVKLYNYEIEYDDYVIRRNVLDGGLSEYDINLVQGKLPKYIIFALSTLERLNGNDSLSLTRFQQNSLQSCDLLLGKKFRIDHKKYYTFMFR